MCYQGHSFSPSVRWGETEGGILFLSNCKVGRNSWGYIVSLQLRGGEGRAVRRNGGGYIRVLLLLPKVVIAQRFTALG